MDKGYITEQLNLAARLLTAHYEQKQSIFEVDDPAVKELFKPAYRKY